MNLVGQRFDHLGMFGSGGKSDRLFYLLLILVVHAFYLNYKIYNLEVSLENALHQVKALSNTHRSVAPEQTTKVTSVTEPKVPRSFSRSMFMDFAMNNPKSPAPKVPERAAVEESKSMRHGIYGGVGDLPHLGGFTERDNSTISYNLWRFLLSEVAVKSLVDVGCGKGHSTKYFHDHGVDVLCIEGSHDAIQQSLLPRRVIVQHDYSQGPWWPDTKTFDLAWSTEFLEHVGRQYMENYVPVFLRSALIIVTSSPWGGWHHVEVHGSWWWKARFEARGLVYSEYLTELFRGMVTFDNTNYAHLEYSQQLMGLHVFINPHVASLPEHRHLFGGHGCFNDVVDNEDGGSPCQGVDALPNLYRSLLECSRWRNDSITPLPAYGQSPWVCKNERSATYRLRH